MVFLLSIGQSLYFFLPAMVANATPPIVAKVPGLKKWETPVDLGRGFLGPHKTIRGIVFGLLFALLVGWWQYRFGQLGVWEDMAVFDYSRLDRALLLSFILGGGALGGDLIKSFFKRRRGILPGESWFWPDKMDFGVGAILVSCFYSFPGTKLALVFLILTPLLSFASTIIGKIIGVRDVWL
jgi:CDP-2,3-bis-(O-geranylgeranyl)-sn-glycerol synthase